MEIYSLSFGAQKPQIEMLAGLVPFEGTPGEWAPVLSPGSCGGQPAWAPLDPQTRRFGLRLSSQGLPHVSPLCPLLL